jgi:heme/copper-type cytochrome/quinol oxidase subunit 3
LARTGRDGDTGGVNARPDPVRARRAQIARWSLLANRIGYLLFGLAIALFVIAFAISFNGTMVTLITICLVVGSILLAPSIVIGYAVKAAEKEDRERGV